MLKANNIRKTFLIERKVTALCDINLEIADGEFFSITGPSGSGKSTLLPGARRHERPNEGKVFGTMNRFLDWELKRRAQWRARTRIAFFKRLT